MTANKRGNLQMLRSGFIVFGTNTNIIREIDVESEQWICDASIALEMWIPEGKDSSRRGLNWTTPWHMAARGRNFWEETIFRGKEKPPGPDRGIGGRWVPGVLNSWRTAAYLSTQQFEYLFTAVLEITTQKMTPYCRYCHFSAQH